MKVDMGRCECRPFRFGCSLVDITLVVATRQYGRRRPRHTVAQLHRVSQRADVQHLMCQTTRTENEVCYVDLDWRQLLAVIIHGFIDVLSADPPAGSQALIDP